MKKICFLGYSKNKTNLISFLRKKKFKVAEYSNKLLTKKNSKKFDLIISFGYKKIIKKSVLDGLKRPIINLHISYLPFNRGSHPNFWSFVENTPKGISIHEIDEKIDTPNIIFRKKIFFKRTKRLTFSNTYKILINKIENLFIKNFDQILKKNYKIKKLRSKGTFHNKSDLPRNFKNWNQKIEEYLNNHPT